MLKNKPQKGFTLIELLVVVAIISLLSSVVLGALNDARAKARDRALVQQVKQIQNALELYRGKYGEYPDANPATVGGASSYYWFVSSTGTCGGTTNYACLTGNTLPEKISEFLPNISLPKTGRLAYYNIKISETSTRNWCTDMSPSTVTGYNPAVGRSDTPPYIIAVSFETNFKDNYPEFVYDNVVSSFTPKLSCFSI